MAPSKIEVLWNDSAAARRDAAETIRGSLVGMVSLIRVAAYVPGGNQALPERDAQASSLCILFFRFTAPDSCGLLFAIMAQPQHSD